MCDVLFISSTLRYDGDIPRTYVYKCIVLILGLYEALCNYKVLAQHYAGDIPRTHAGPIVAECIVLILMLLWSLRHAGEIWTSNR